MGTKPGRQTALSSRQLSRGEQETESAAKRLSEHVEEALAAVAVERKGEIETLESVADRIERAARDLAGALRELAHERQAGQDQSDS